MSEARELAQDRKRFPRSLLSRSLWIGDYDYVSFFVPAIPCLSKTRRTDVFLGLNDKIPILLAAVMGLQHALAVSVATATFPRVVSGAGPGHLNLAPSDQAHLISLSLIIPGLMSLLSIVRIRLIYGYYLGSGLIVLSGTSLAFIGIAEAMIKNLTEEGICKPGSPCPEAYGMWLGTVMVGSLVVIALSFLRPRAIRALFPSIVTGVTIFLLGSSIIAMGLRYWGGGSGQCFRQRMIKSMGGTPDSNLLLCPNSTSPRAYPWGDGHWIGLGFFVLIVIITAEIFGSRFMRGTQVAIGLILGTILSAALGYLPTKFIKEAPVITFAWVRWYGVGFYAPALIPVMIAYLAEAMDTVGDLAATCELSKVRTSGEEYESRIQGGLLADGLNSLISALMCGSPLTTYSITPAVIAVSQTANRSAGIWGCFWLVLMGVFGKIGGLLVSVPDPVIGATLAYLAAGMTISGLKMISETRWTRRDRFILSVAFAVGLGLVIVPDTFQHFIPEARNGFIEALRQSLKIILRSGFTAGSMLTVILNLCVPEAEDYYQQESELENLEEDVTGKSSFDSSESV